MKKEMIRKKKFRKKKEKEKEKKRSLNFIDVTWIEDNIWDY